MDTLFTILPFFLVAMLYASVGHGGASGYLAVMALMGMEAILLRPTALGLNVMVSILGTVAFFRAGHFRGRLFWPLALAAIPFAFWGGSLEIHEELFRKILGLALIIALFRLLFTPRAGTIERTPTIWQLLLVGSIIGFLSGLIGVGGGIFLTPLVILLSWSSPKTAAAISAPFILVNSLAGLAGLQPGMEDFHPLFPWLALAVISGGLIGSRWGSRYAYGRQIRFALAAVLALAALKLII